MGLFGALFAGVSGLNSQSNKIGIISNNISNVNTVGFKEGQAAFDTLVVPSGTTSFSPGGVIGNTQQLVNQQGLIQATTSATDISITGNGFFAVNTKADGSGIFRLTRAGSFTQDSAGNFVNANGNFLQGIPVTTPATSVNINNLKTVNVNQSASGAATATSLVTLAANFNAAQAVLLGSGVTGTMQAVNGTSPNNVGLTSTQIIVSNDKGAAPTNNLTRGNTFQIISGAPASATDTFTYGGFMIGRDVTSALLAGEGDGGNLLLVTPETIAANNMSIPNNSTTLTINVPDIQNYQNTNQNITIAGFTGTLGNIPATAVNGQHLITGVSGVGPGAGTITVTLGTANTSGAAVVNGGATFTLSNRTNAFTGNILNATSETSDFLSNGTTPLSTSNFSSQAIKFTITAGSNPTATFTYSPTTNPTAGTFNNLDTLAAAISASPGLTARVVNSRLYVSGTDATQAVTFANGDAVGTPTTPGINWIQELDLKNLAAPAASAHMFNSLAGLAQQINTADPANLVAAVQNPNSSSTITINEANPKQTITFTDGQLPASGSILKELGIDKIAPNLSGFETSGVLAVKYDPTQALNDMSSGNVTAQFSHDVTIFDAQGNAHTIAMNVVKLATNTWGIELTAVPASDVISTIKDGQIAYGTVKFDGTGALQSSTLPTSIPINWTNGAAASTVTVDLGLGKTTGLTQSAAPYNVSLANQNGSPIGQLTGVTIDASGFVIETFSNGQTQKAYQVPLADVSNPDGLEAVSGDAFQETLASGQVNLNIAGNGGTGTITPSALEQSNVDLSTQLTSLIVAQQAYGANSKLLTVTDQLLQQLDSIIQ